MAIIAILLFLVFFWLLHKISKTVAESVSSYFIILFLSLVANIIPVGYLMSYFYAINKPIFWSLTLVSLGALEFWLVKYLINNNSNNQIHFRLQIKEYIGELIKSLNFPEKVIFGSLLLAFVICTSINTLVLLTTFPNEWDSMTGHLVKCAYYLQNGHMGRVNGTTWSIDYYPNSLPTLQIFGYHLIGEKGFKLIHFVSYWVFIATTYGIAKLLFNTKKGAVFSAFMAALLPSALIQAVTTETDIVQSAYLGMVVYFLLVVNKKPSWLNIVLLGLSVSVWISHKVTFMLIGPAVFLIGLYVLLDTKDLKSRILPAFGILGLGLAIYVLPNGYIGNLRQAEKFSLGALSAPPEVMKWHGIEGYSTSDKVKNLQFNILRYSSDFLQLDGLRNTEVGAEINNAFRYFPNKFFNKFGLDRRMFWVVFPFETMGDPQMKFYRERPFWGIISFMLFLPIAVYILWVFAKHSKRRKELLLPILFLGAAVIHFLSLSFSAPYDPIKGRYFMNMAVWCLPLLSFYFQEKKGAAYLAFCSIIVGISAIPTLTHRGLYPLVGENSIFKLDRIAQLNVTRPEGTEAYYNFEKLVPDDAIVALGTQQEHEDYVYPLWGKNFNRTLIPIHPFRSPVKPIPKEAEYLFYSEGVIPYQEGDILLGEGDKTPDTPVPESKFFLRKL